MKLTNKTAYKQGQAVRGVYHGVAFTGRINDETRPTPCYRGMHFWITLDAPITVFGWEKKVVCIEDYSETNWAEFI